MQQKNRNHDVVTKCEFNTHVVNVIDHFRYWAVILIK